MADRVPGAEGSRYCGSPKIKIEVLRVAQDDKKRKNSPQDDKSPKRRSQDDKKPGNGPQGDSGLSS